MLGKLNAKMITLGRESRFLTQRALAEQLSITTAKMSRVEKDNPSISENLLEAFSKSLNYPKSFFYQNGEAIPMNLNFRKKQNVPQKLIVPIEAQINIYRLIIGRLFQALKRPTSKIPLFDLGKTISPAKVAEELRQMWRIERGPLADLIEIIESKGIIVLSFDFGTERVDSRTILTNERQPIIVLNKSMLGDRLRFSLAYELGHLIMHTFANLSADRNIGHEANLFAAELLMPKKDIKSQLNENLKITDLAELKCKWKVSMQAILYRANDLNIITNNQKRYLLEQFNTLNIRRREPIELDIPKETPKLLKNLIAEFKSKHRFSVKEVADFFNLEQEDFLKLFHLSG